MAGLIGQYQQGAFTTPVNGTTSDASVVLGNDNNVRTKHNSHDNDATIHVQSSVLASRPAAGTAQRVWITTDGLRAYIDTGAGWSELAYLSLAAGGTVAGATTFSAGITSTTGTFSGAVQGTDLIAGAGSNIEWAGRSVMLSPADGIITLYNDAVTGFSRLQFGGTTSSFPSLKRSSAALVARLADDSADAAFTCAALTATTGTFSGHITGSGDVRAGAANALYWNGRANMYSPADGEITLYNTALTNFSLLRFGGTTSSFPAIKRSSAALHCRLADDSDYASLAAAGGTFSGAVVSTSASSGIGYATGAGGTVTQITSKSTGVTLNTVTGQITTHNAALAAGAVATFTVTNSSVAATDTVLVSLVSGSSTVLQNVFVSAVAAGSFNVTIYNESGGSPSDALVINFAVIKGVTS